MVCEKTFFFPWFLWGKLLFSLKGNKISYIFSYSLCDRSYGSGSGTTRWTSSNLHGPSYGGGYSSPHSPTSRLHTSGTTGSSSYYTPTPAPRTTGTNYSSTGRSMVGRTRTHEPVHPTTISGYSSSSSRCAATYTVSLLRVKRSCATWQSVLSIFIN